MNDEPLSWDELFLRHVYLIASKTKDMRTKIGAVLVKDRRIISEGYNGLCRGVNDKVSERFLKGEKQYFLEHAERNAIFSCAYFGTSSKGSSCYTNGLPCTDCTRALIQGGVEKIYVHHQWMKHEEEINGLLFKERSKRPLEMLNEARIPVLTIDLYLGVKTRLDDNDIMV